MEDHTMNYVNPACFLQLIHVKLQKMAADLAGQSPLSGLTMKHTREKDKEKNPWC